MECPICDRSFATIQALSSHKWRAHGNGSNHKPFAGKSHVVNPMKGKQHSNSAKRKMSEKAKARVLSVQERLKISDSMKLAHKEGRAWNIGQNRWNNVPSWPEEFFMMVIENEFDDKNFVREYPFGRYSLDFAWPHLKCCIEIDGEQHLQEDQARRDKKKDAALLEAGWKILRIKWRAMYLDTKFHIAAAKSFVLEASR